MEKLTKKLVGDDKRAKKYGVNTLKTVALTLQNGESKTYAKILGTKIYKYLELIDPETTLSSLLQSDRQFLKRLGNEEKYHLSNVESSLATLSELKISKRKKKSNAKMSILGGKKEILNDARRIMQIIPINDMQTLLITIDEIYDFQTTMYNTGSVPPSTIVYKHENMCDMELLVESFFRNKFPQANKRHIGTLGASLLHACTTYLYDLRVRTFYYVLTSQVSMNIKVEMQKMIDSYRRHLDQISLLEGHYGQGIAWKKNIMASLTRFFTQLNSLQIEELKDRLEEETPWSVVATGMLVTMRYPSGPDMNATPPSPLFAKKKKKLKKKGKSKTKKNKPYDSFMHYLGMLYLEANRKYYLDFRDKLAQCNPTESEQVAAPLVELALRRADPFLNKLALKHRLMKILEISDSNELADSMVNPPGKSLTKFINVQKICKLLLCSANFFPTRFYIDDYAKTKPCIVFDTRGRYNATP